MEWDKLGESIGRLMWNFTRIWINLLIGFCNSFMDKKQKISWRMDKK